MQNFSNSGRSPTASGRGLPFSRVETNWKLVWVGEGLGLGLVPQGCNPVTVLSARDGCTGLLAQGARMAADHWPATPSPSNEQSTPRADGTDTQSLALCREIPRAVLRALGYSDAESWVVAEHQGACLSLRSAAGRGSGSLGWFPQNNGGRHPLAARLGAPCVTVLCVFDASRYIDSVA